MSIEISRYTRNEASPDSTLRSGEPIGNLSPIAIELYRASLRKQGVSLVDAEKGAIVLSDLCDPTSNARHSLRACRLRQIVGDIRIQPSWLVKLVGDVDASIDAAISDTIKGMVGVMDPEANGRRIPLPTEADIFIEKAVNS